MNCTLCGSTHCKLFYKDEAKSRTYLLCAECDLVFASPDSWLSSLDEKSRYSTHNNDIRDTGYQNFLNQMWSPLKKFIPKNSHGLDFGCGPTKAFAELAAQDGFQVESFDPYFFNNRELLDVQYDFIWCSEVFEHFYSPSSMLNVLNRLLKAGSVLAIMTEERVPVENFHNWYYRLDDTHVSFFSSLTMEWVGKHTSWKRTNISSRVNFFVKP